MVGQGTGLCPEINPDTNLSPCPFKQEVFP